MYYTARKGKSKKNFVVIKAPIRDMGNCWKFGVKFCQGYGIVEKDSKIYYAVTRSLLFKGFKELPLAFLLKVFKSKDIELIFGRDIYLHYLDAVQLTSSQVKNRIGDSGVAIRTPKQVTLETKITPEQPVIEAVKCSYIKANGTVCGNSGTPASKLGYCFGHLRYDETRKSVKEVITVQE